MKLQKLWPLFGALCLSLSTAFADGTTQNGSSTYCSGMDPSSESGQETYQRGTFREITPSAGPRVAHGADVFVTADFIWWKASEGGLNFSENSVIPKPYEAATPEEVFAPIPEGSFASVGEDWAPGFKVGIGLNTGHDGWDIYTQYTWLQPSDKKTQKGSNLKVPNYPIDYQIDPTTATTGIDENKATWDLRFHAIDLELGRNFYLSQFFTMRPHIGLKGTWQDHDWKITSKIPGGVLVTIENPTGTEALTGPSQIEKHYNVWGIGVRGGLNIACYISKCWSIYGDLSLSNLWTNYYKQTSLLKIDDSGSTEGPRARAIQNGGSGHTYTCRYVAELDIGLRWETWFYDDNYHFAIQAGWEQQNWINWSQFERLGNLNSMDMSLQGPNLKLRFDF